ncbi:OmpH family outer membrane protein [PVC group bacterium]|nr:OmpH family outer membrane protein [PVC group bacterium]
MSHRKRIRTFYLISLPVLTLIAVSFGYRSVASAIESRPPTVVVVFSILDVMDKVTERADLNIKLKGFGDQVQEEYDNRTGDILALEESLEGAADEDREEIIEELQKREVELKAYKSFLLDQIDTKKAWMLQDLYNKINDTISKIASANNYDLVLASDTGRELRIFKPNEVKMSRENQINEQLGLQRIFFASDLIDITDQIVTQMNLDWETEKGN